MQEAKQLYEKALGIRQKLAAANPGDTNLQVDLLETMTLVGSIHYLLGDLDGAAELGRQRLKMEEQLRANHDSEKLEHEIANTLEGNGFFEIWLGDYDSAFDDERRALTMNEAFLRADPASARNLGRVLVSHNWIAMTLKFDRKFAAAANEFQQGIQIDEQLAVRDPNDAGVRIDLAGKNEELCKSLAYAGSFSQVRSICQKSIAINESLVKSDKNNVQAVADLASSNLTMGLALYLMHSRREALVFVERSDSMFRAVALRDPDPLSNGMVHAVALLYAGRIEASLHHPELASKNLAEAQALLERLAKRSPKHRYILDALNETRQAIDQLPRDTAPLAVH